MKRTGGIAVPNVEGYIEPSDMVRVRAQRRIRLLAIGFLFGLSILGLRGAQLCVQPDERIIAAGSTQRWEQMTLRAIRGNILASDDRPLAASVNTPNVVVDPSLVDSAELDSVSAQVAAVLNMDVSVVSALMSKKGRYAKLASRVHPEVADRIRQIKHPALFTESDGRRYYPERELGAHVLGFVSADGDGQMGLEKSMDKYLRGSTVLLQRRRDRKGLDVDRFRDVDRTSPSGMDVYTTIDRQIQHYTDRALADIVEKFQPKGAMAVVVDVPTGNILAMSNVPTYNPNVINGKTEPRRNRVLQNAIEPGSVIKPFILGAALEEGQLTPSTPVDCEGGVWYVGRSRIRDDHPHNVVTASEVVKYSSNIGTAKIALGMGAETTIGYLNDFGFGVKTGVQMPSERKGFMRPISSIRPIELATTSYGQGMTVNALQLAMATATIANGGVRMKPRLVTQIIDEQGVPAWRQEPEAVMRVLSEDTAANVTRMMVSVVEPGGTGTKASVPGYKVAGKTGTAQKVTDKVYGSARIGSFIGFLPAENPKLAIVVIVDEPQGPIKYGGWVAGPAFSRIASQSLAYLGVAPTRPQNEDPDDTAPLPEPSVVGGKALVFADGHWTMPELEGRGIRAALRQVQGLGLSLDVSGSGVLVSQDPAPGEPVTAGGSVRLHFEPRF